MCGIAGIIGERYTREDLAKMLQTITHRGPDSSLEYEDHECLLGHNRLSIIDLSSRANQPFSDKSGRYQLVFNGEIYNYRELKSEIGNRYDFKTNSDTEVLIAAYIVFGRGCLEKLNGMFAFAIWDKQQKLLFAARDRFGVKPFYYSKNHSNLIFASEIKAIHSLIPVVPNEKTWAKYLSYGSYGDPHSTFYKDVLQLEAGHYLEYRSGKLKNQCWYNFSEKIEQANTEDFSEIAIKRRYTELLEDSIKLRFRADVEVGFNLSGGVDSSLLLALVNQIFPAKNIKAYTFYTGDQRYDELPWVEKMIQKTGNPLRKIKLNYEEVPELSENIGNFQDEPFGGIPTLAYSKIFRAAAKEGIRVLLDGQGMDEQWAGYDYYNTKNDTPVQGTQISPFCLSAIHSDFLKIAEKPVYPVPFSSCLQNQQFRDLFYTKLPRALRFNDRISMASSTELREPFLDYRLVELAFSLPDEMKIRGSIQKYILREIVKEYVPFEIAEAPKRALQTPQREWLGKELRTFVTGKIDCLFASEFSNWFNKDQLYREWKRYQMGSNETSFYIWQWVNTALMAKNCS